MQLHQRFQALLAGESRLQREQLDRLVSHYPMEFRTWAVAWICSGGQGPRALRLLQLLHQSNLLRGLLVNPGAMPLRDAIRVSKLAQRSIANFDWVVAGSIREGTETQAARALQVLQHVPLTSRVVPGLAAALRNPNGKIRSLVSKLMGRLCDNPTTIGALLKDTDSRVRANAVEGLWESDHPVAHGLLRKALLDPDNRVVANAALGLSRAGDREGIEALHRMSAHPDPRYRLSATWCIEQLGDRSLSPLIEALAEDRVSKVHEAARAALSRILNPEQQSGARLMIAVSQAYRTTDGVVRLRCYVADQDDNPLDLSPGCFRVFHGQALLPRREIRPPARREALVTILWLADEDIDRAAQDKAREAILAAMHHKRPEDLHCVIGSGLRPTLAFSSDLGQLSDALYRANTNEAKRPDGSALGQALALSASRTGCRTVIAFSGGSPPRQVNADRLVEQAVKQEIAIHVVVFARTAAARVWSQIASETQGSLRVVDDEDGLQDAFWRVFSQVSSGYAMSFGPLAESNAESNAESQNATEEFRVEVRSAAGYGEARFEPLLQQDGM